MENPQAFPNFRNKNYEGRHDFFQEPTEGMTLRDYFAGQALMGFCTMLSLEFKTTSIETTRVESDWAKLSYKIADAMLLERSKGKGGGNENSD
jgi:hypothetical protein